MAHSAQVGLVKNLKIYTVLVEIQIDSDKLLSFDLGYKTRFGDAVAAGLVDNLKVDPVVDPVG
jgi:hypothetical protein